MATFKCKMCGGDLQLVEGETVCECEYCGSRQTVPSADDEKKMTLFNRANRLRFNNEFDKAAGVYESIIADFPEEAEAYWGLILCKYGIEYVDDPATGKKIPTCHRSSFESVFDDQNFEMVMEYSDAMSKRVYREEAKQIEELRKGIIEVSSKEEPYDIFICYKETDENGDRTLDSVIAQDIYNALTEKGYKVFFSRITLEDKLGQEYEPYIFAALHSAKVMLAVGTQYEYYDAVWVKNEWSRFLQLISSGEKKTLIPVYKNLDAYDMPKEFAKLQAQDMGKIGAMQDLLRGLEKLFDKGSSSHASTQQPANAGVLILNAQTNSLLKRGYMALEDRDYEKGAEFFEQVLNNDPESGQAYWGKLLCAYQVSNSAGLAQKLADKVKESAKTETISFPIDAVKAARTAAGNSTVLDELGDDELRETLKYYLQKPITYESIRAYLEQAIGGYENAESLKTLISNRDYERSIQYKDSEIESNINAVVGLLKQNLEQAINEDEAGLKAVQEQAESAFRGLSEKIHERLSKAIESYSAKKEELAAAEEKAYQDAVDSYEQSYQIQLESWKNEKDNYDQNYQNAVDKQSSLQNQIRRLEEEKSNLHGLFTGRRKGELESNIMLLRKQLGELSIPKDPGPEPVKGPAPDRTKIHESFTAKTGNPRDAIIKALSPLSNFGRYQYDRGVIKPIKWTILDVQADKALIISKYGIDTVRYHEKFEETTWEKCTLRKWLNNDFINSAFTQEEQSQIETTTVTADENPDYSTDPGNDTQDKVFLLSIPEAEKYFENDSERTVTATPYAKKQGAYVADNGDSRWWLRSPGNYAMNAARVLNVGSVSTYGDLVDFDNYVVRPALWISIKNL